MCIAILEVAINAGSVYDIVRNVRKPVEWMITMMRLKHLLIYCETDIIVYRWRHNQLMETDTVLNITEMSRFRRSLCVKSEFLVTKEQYSIIIKNLMRENIYRRHSLVTCA